MQTPSRLRRLALALLPLLALLPAIAPGAAAAPPTVSWSAEQTRSASSAVRNVYPDLGYDAQGKTHLAWIEYSTDNPDGTPSGPSRVLYTNNVAGGWRAPYEVSASVARHSNSILAMELENNRVHILYQADSLAITHRYLTIAGDGAPTKSATTKLSAGGKGYNPNMTFSGGGLHAFWIDNRASATQQVYHRIWQNGAWEARDRAVRASGVLQTFPKSAATADGRIHAAWNEGNASARYSTFNGSSWVAGPDLGSGKVRNVALASNGSTLFALYTRAEAAGGGLDAHNVYMRRGGNGSWSNPVLLSSGGGYDETPELFYSPVNARFYALWASGPLDANTTTLVAFREITPEGIASDLGVVGGRGSGSSDNARGAGGPATLSVVWQDKATGVLSVRMSTATVRAPSTPTPTPMPTDTPAPPTATPTNTPIPPITFDATRISPSPTNNLQVAVTLSNVQGGPTQLRYSLTPFVAGSAAPAWGAYAPQQPGFTLDAPAALGATCGAATVYVQLRNSLTASPVKTVAAVIDTTVQSGHYLRNPNLAGNQLPGGPLPASQNPYAPDAGADDFTRDARYYYRLSPEWPQCAGLQSYRDQAGLTSVPAGSPQGYFAAVSPAAGLDTGADPAGRGYPEQPLTATLQITDRLGQQISVERRMRYDDDPPVLAEGGALDFAAPGPATRQALVTLAFTATVTDDGYGDLTPSGKNYWGVWALAVDPAVTEAPTPSQFRQHGQALRLEAGATTVHGVKLTNGLAAGPGQRRVYLAFLDGAGNFSGFAGGDAFAGGLLVSPIIALEAPIELPRRYLPLLRKEAAR